MKKGFLRKTKTSLMFGVSLITVIIIFVAMLLLSFYADSMLYKNSFNDTRKYSFQLFAQAWYQETMRNPDTSYFLPPHIPDHIANINDPVISFVQTIKMYPGGTPLGLMLIDLNISSLESICNNISLGEDGYTYIINSKGEYIYYPNASFLATGDETASFPDSVCTQKVSDFPVPKLIIQPLVENAIYHGINPAWKKCNLPYTRSGTAIIS